MSKSPSLRRIQADVRELALDPSDRYHAAPLENDMFEWHFTIRGADGTDFEGGVYHGRILLPPEYPFKPPHIVFLTPSGRFETHTKVCLSFSAFHPELWQPAWGIRLILEALISFLPTPADGAIGALDWTSTERKKLAKKSVDFCCMKCGGKVIDLLPKLSDSEKAKKASASNQFCKEIEKLKELQIVNESKNKQEDEGKSDDNKIDETKEPIDETTREVSKTEEIRGELKEPPPQTQPPEEKQENKLGDDDKKVEAEPSSPTTGNADATVPDEPDSTEPNQDNVQQARAADLFSYDISWMTDPMLNVTIVLLAVICWLFMRRAHALLDELAELKREMRE